MSKRPEIIKEPVTPSKAEDVSHKITKRQRPDLLKDVYDLEDIDTGVIVSIDMKLYESMSKDMTDEAIFRQLSLFHDTADREIVRRESAW